MPKRKKTSPNERGFDVGWWDEDLGRWVHWEDRQTDEFQRLQAARHFENWRHPMMWALRAHELHGVANFLWRTYEQDDVGFLNPERPPVRQMPSVALMLAGMSFECALKAYLLTAYKIPISYNDHRSVARGAHDLAALLKKTGMRSNRADREALRQISEFVRWNGRYPLPKTLVELEDSYTSARHSYEELWKRYQAIRSKFGQRVYQATMRYMNTGRART